MLSVYHEEGEDMVKIECVAATICICILVIRNADGVVIDMPKTGALSGETFVEGDVMGDNDDLEEESHIHNIVLN